MNTLKRGALLALIALLSLYMRQRATDAGKVWLWRRVILPHLSWRPFSLRARLRSGQVVDGSLNDLIFLHLFFFGVWEPALSAFLQATLKEGDTVIDVGANIGVHTLLAARCVGPRGTVHAIEASPTIFRLLQGSIAANGLGNVVARNLAVTEARQSVTIFRHDASNLGGSTIMADRAGGDEAAYVAEAVVEGMPLIDAVGEAAFRAARLIKIDVEGAELAAVRGMLAHVEALRDDVVVIIECSPESLAASGLDRAGFLALMAGHGFEPQEIPNTYTVADYLASADLAPRPLVWTDDRQVDLVFRRSGAARAVPQAA